jgi:hypothetical protein
MEQSKLDIKFLTAGLSFTDSVQENFNKMLTDLLSVVPAQIAERVSNDCRFLIIGRILGAYLPNVELEEKNLILLHETLFLHDNWAFIILHEIAHFACGHENFSVTNEESLLELMDQEESANALALRWSKEFKKQEGGD